MREVQNEKALFFGFVRAGLDKISVSKEKLIIKTRPYELILNSRFIYALYH